MNAFTLFDSLLDAIFVIDENRKVVFCNSAGAKLVGRTKEDASEENNLYELIEFSDENLFCMPGGEVGKMDPTGYLELNYLIPNSEKTGALQVCVQPIKFEGKSYWSVICHDSGIEKTLNDRQVEQLEELERYSKELEERVADRTREITSTKNLMQAMMDSLGQGFLVLDKNGMCGDIYTKSCLEILECDPEGKKITEILNVRPERIEEIELWLKTLYLESLPFESLKELGPNEFSHSRGKNIILDFYPIRDNEGAIQNLVMVATDKTAENKAHMEMEKEKQFSHMILKLVKNKEQFTQFLSQLEPKINHLVKFTKAEDQFFDVPKILRFLHTIEGEAGMFNIEVIRSHARSAQQALEPLKTGWAEDFESIRGEFNVEIAKMAYGFENFIRKNNKTFRSLGVFGNKKIEIEETRLNLFYEQLVQGGAPKTLINQFLSEFIYQPIKYYLSHYDDLIKSIAGKQGKEIPNVEFIDCDIKVDGRRFNKLFQALVHAFRNSIDHGIEAPEERISQGKPPQGTVSVECSTFEMDKKFLQISIRDDGRGIDADLIKEKLESRGHDVKYKSMSDYDVLQQIFIPGFSSREQIGEYSGRGIGMDAIKSEVKALSGEVSFKSLPGSGSTLTIVVPFKEEDAQNKKAA